MCQTKGFRIGMISQLGVTIIEAIYKVSWMKANTAVDGVFFCFCFCFCFFVPPCHGQLIGYRRQCWQVLYGVRGTLCDSLVWNDGR